MALVSFKKGLLASLPSAYSEGTFYVTTDERAIYLDVSNSARIRLGDFQEFETVEALQANNNPSTSALYYISGANVLAKYNGTDYVQINLDTGATSVEVVGEGNAVTAASYDPVARKLTLTMGATFAEVPNVYQVTSDSTDIDELTDDITGKPGDVLIVTSTASNIKSAYQYDKEYGWVACDGNVDASTVILKGDITLAGNYTQVGNLTKSSTTATSTFEVDGKSVQAALVEILSKREQPKITGNPAVSLTFSQAKAYEVGTSVTPSWSASLSAGSYTYGPATGITATSWSIKDSGGHTSTVASGSFPAFTVGDGEDYWIEATATHGAGAVAKDNLGDPSNPTVQIAAGSKTKKSSSVTGYRSFFYGVLGTSSAEAPLTSAIIRGLTNGGAYSASKTFTLNANAVSTPKRIVVAVPHSSITSSRTGVSEVILTSAMNTPVTDSYTHAANAVKVEGVASYSAADYDVWVYEPASIDAGEVHKITLK